MIWIRSSQKAKLDREQREEALEKALAELDEIAGKLNQGKLKTRTRIKQVVGLLLANHGVKEFLQVKIRSRTETEHRYCRRGRPRKGDPVRVIRRRVYFLETSKNKERIKEEARTDGVFPLTSNLKQSYGKRQILEIYKYQPYVERRFSTLKSELRVAPVFLKKPIRAAGMIHAYFIAIALSSLIERTVRLNMKKKDIETLPLFPEERETRTPTAPRILEAFSELAWVEFEQAGDLVTFPLQLNATQKLLLSLLEVPKEVYA